MRTLARAADVENLRVRLRSVRPDLTARWGKMSVHQMVCHLADTFRMTTPELPTADISTAASRTLMKWIALYAPMPWPRGIETVREIDQLHGGTRPTDFAADLVAAERELDRLAAGAAAPSRPSHPIFGPLSEAQWLRWGYLHVDHHLRQFGV